MEISLIFFNVESLFCLDVLRYFFPDFNNKVFILKTHIGNTSCKTQVATNVCDGSMTVEFD